MKKYLVIPAIFAVFGSAFIGCSDEKQAQQMPPLPVAAMKVKIGDQPLLLSFNGQTFSDFDVMLKAKVSGSITEQLFTPGAQVKEGDQLLKIDEGRYKALYDSAKGAYQAAAATEQNAGKEFNRVKVLKEKNAVSQKDYDNALAAYTAAAANTKTALGSAKSAKIDWQDSMLLAPFDGVVGDNRQNVGSFAERGSELVRISKLDPIYVRFGMSDVRKLEIDNSVADGSWKRLNPTVSMVIDGKKYTGKLIFIDSVVNSDTASVEAKAVFENKDHAIKPGIYTKIEVDGFFQKNAFRIPQKLVSQDPKGSYVYAIKDNKIEKKYIKIASNSGFDYIVSSGLDDGDILAMDNFKKIGPGSAVQIINDPNNPTAMPAAPKPENNATK